MLEFDLMVFGAPQYFTIENVQMELEGFEAGTDFTFENCVADTDTHGISKCSFKMKENIDNTQKGEETRHMNFSASLNYLDDNYNLISKPFNQTDLPITVYGFFAARAHSLYLHSAMRTECISLRNRFCALGTRLCACGCHLLSYPIGTNDKVNKQSY